MEYFLLLNHAKRSSAKRNSRISCRSLLPVPDLHKNQSLGRRRHTGLGADPRFQYLFYFFRLVKAPPHPDQGAGDDADHIVEKAVAADADDDLLCLRLPVREVSFRAGTLLHLQAVDAPHRVLCVGADTAETGKIVLSHEISCALPHLLHIQGHVHKGAGALFHGIGRPGIVNVVLVGLGDIVLVSGMPGEGHFLGLYDHNVLRQLLVQSQCHPLRRNSALRVKDRHISQGVDAGVSTAGANDPDVLLCEGTEFFIEDLLYRDPVWLDLPAAVVCAIVGHCQLYPSQVSFPL